MVRIWRALMRGMRLPLDGRREAPPDDYRRGPTGGQIAFRPASMQNPYRVTHASPTAPDPRLPAAAAPRQRGPRRGVPAHHAAGRQPAGARAAEHVAAAAVRA